MEIKDYTPTVDAMNKEINTWRKHFLDVLFNGEFKHLPEYSKNLLTSYFLSIPSEAFSDPLSELHKCVSAMVQHLEDRR